MAQKSVISKVASRKKTLEIQSKSATPIGSLLTRWKSAELRKGCLEGPRFQGAETIHSLGFAPALASCCQACKAEHGNFMTLPSDGNVGGSAANPAFISAALLTRDLQFALATPTPDSSFPFAVQVSRQSSVNTIYGAQPMFNWGRWKVRAKGYSL